MKMRDEMGHVNISIDGTLRPRFEEAYISWLRERTPKGNFATPLPPMSGPDQNNAVTYLGVPKEFLKRLQEMNISFSEVS
jgi:hypothetical protein